MKSPRFEIQTLNTVSKKDEEKRNIYLFHPLKMLIE